MAMEAQRTEQKIRLIGDGRFRPPAWEMGQETDPRSGGMIGDGAKGNPGLGTSALCADQLRH
jgi:hypothetical protein